MSLGYKIFFLKMDIEKKTEVKSEKNKKKPESTKNIEKKTKIK